MRSSNKSRSRNKNNNRNRGVGNVINRNFDSAGPEGKVRGTPQQIIEKYMTLARDAQLSGDRVAGENFQQHAEHYVRLLNDAQREQAERQAAEARNRQQSQPQPPEGEQPPVVNGVKPAPQTNGDARPDAEVVQTSEMSGAEVLGPETDSGLVETPEQTTPQPRAAEKPARSRSSRSRTRRPAGKAEEGAEADTPQVEDERAADTSVQ